KPLSIPPFAALSKERRSDMPPLTWDQPEDIAMALYDKFPQQDPLKVRFTDLHKWITELDGFGDDPSKSNEGKLEAIQMAWHEEWRENQEKCYTRKFT